MEKLRKGVSAAVWLLGLALAGFVLLAVGVVAGFGMWALSALRDDGWRW